MKKVFKIKITTTDGSVSNQFLKLSEFNIIRQIIKENKSVTIEEIEISEALFNHYFKS